MRNRKFPKHFLVVICLFVSTGTPNLQAEKPATELDVVPKPARVEIQSGAFEFGPETRIYLETGDRDAHWVGEYLSRLLSGPM
ncbi:MAG TPA: hypothetical protein VJW77_03955, partial [Terriglobia bacterium]|nr:hypothetical protein [Terriglobia bacterium]